MKASHLQQIPVPTTAFEPGGPIPGTVMGHLFNINNRKRFSLAKKDKKLQYASDGSLTIYIQHDKPAATLVSNWLPSPDGDFAMTIRCYWPDEVLQNGDWLAPVVEKAK